MQWFDLEKKPSKPLIQDLELHFRKTASIQTYRQFRKPEKDQRPTPAFQRYFDLEETAHPNELGSLREFQDHNL